MANVALHVGFGFLFAATCEVSMGFRYEGRRLPHRVERLLAAMRWPAASLDPNSFRCGHCALSPSPAPAPLPSPSSQPPEMARWQRVAAGVLAVLTLGTTFTLGLGASLGLIPKVGPCYFYCLTVGACCAPAIPAWDRFPRCCAFCFGLAEQQCASAAPLQCLHACWGGAAAEMRLALTASPCYARCARCAGDAALVCQPRQPGYGPLPPRLGEL